MRNPLFIVTGAMGHLGNTIIHKLAEDGARVRGFILPNDNTIHFSAAQAEMVEGDVCRPESLEPLFAGTEGEDVILIHTAGIVSIASKYQQKVYDVNVQGTKNIVDACLRHHVKKLVHVSSVHAIPEGKKGDLIREADHFDPADVHGLYAQTKAEATQYVLNSAKQGLDASVVHPSGIIGPGDYGHGHLTQLVMDFLDGRLTACVKGGYDFVDVRDVTDGILRCVDAGRPGECYILSGAFCPVEELLRMLSELSGHKRVRTVLPLWFAKATAPLSEVYYRLKKQPPLYTAYSLYTLGSNANFTHEKATRELGYQPRPLSDTLRDTIAWLCSHHRLKRFKAITA